MNDPFAAGAPLLIGLAMGAIFFGSLWWTVRAGVVSRTPAAFFLVSHVARMALTLGGFYFVADGQWHRLLLCLAGFLMARAFVTRFVAVGDSLPLPTTKESPDATQPR